MENYQEAFKRCGVPKELRSPEHYFFEYDEQGNAFPIPREINIGTNAYKLEENGAVVSFDAFVSSDAEIGPRTIIAAGTIVALRAQIGTNCLVSHGVEIDEDVSIGDNVVIGAKTQIGKQAKIADYAMVSSSVLIGHNSQIDKHTLLAKKVETGPFSSVGLANLIQARAKIFGRTESDVNIGMSAVVGQGASIGSGAELADTAIVNAGRKIKPRTFVVPKRFKKTRYGN